MRPNVDPLGELLRAAGPRVAVPAERARRVEAAVRREWQDLVQQRTGRRRAAWIAASGVIGAALILLVLHTHARSPTNTATSAGTLAAPVPAAVPHEHGAYFRATDENRPPDRGLPRHVLASYAAETR